MNRREFLKKVIFLIGAGITAGMGFLGGGYFLSPLWRKSNEDWAEVGLASEIKVGTPTKVEFTVRRRDGWVVIEDRSSAWVVTADGKNFSVYDPHCTHLGCPYRWDNDKHQFLCPCHNAVFAVDGAPLSGPAPRALDRMPFKVVGGKLYVKPGAKAKAA